MAVDANTYGSVAGVERLVGDVVASRTFGASTVPTTTQVELLLDDIAAELNSLLDTVGYTAKISSSGFPLAYNYVAAANNYGAAAAVLKTIPGQASIGPEGEELGNARANMYQARFNDCLERIKKRQLRAGMREGRLANVYTGAQKDDDSNVKLPLFKRGQDDYPGSRSLVE